MMRSVAVTSNTTTADRGLLGRPCVVLVKCGRCRRVRPQTSKLVTAFEET